MHLHEILTLSATLIDTNLAHLAAAISFEEITHHSISNLPCPNCEEGTAEIQLPAGPTDIEPRYKQEHCLECDGTGLNNDVFCESCGEYLAESKHYYLWDDEHFCTEPRCLRYLNSVLKDYPKK